MELGHLRLKRRDAASLVVAAGLVTIVSVGETHDRVDARGAFGGEYVLDGGAGHQVTCAPSPATPTVAELWRIVRTRESEVRAAVVAHKLGELRRIASALRDVVARLPSVSGDLKAERRAELASAVRYVATLAERLGAAGDAGDQSSAEANVRQLSGVLDTIESMYPQGVVGVEAGHRRSRHATVTGEIVAACYIEKGDAGRGPAHRDCAIRSIEEGRPPFIRDEKTGRLYLVALPSSTQEDRERWLAKVGHRVRVTGMIEERDGMRLLEVEKVRSEHDHEAAPHGGVVGMAGEHHLEVVTTADNEIRVYLLDAFMTPRSVAGLKGIVLVTGAASRRSTLAPDPRGDYLRVIDTRLAPDDESITVTLEIERDPVTMTLPFRRADANAPAARKHTATDHHDHHHDH